jgi:hypothetical protein
MVSAGRRGARDPKGDKSPSPAPPASTRAGPRLLRAKGPESAAQGPTWPGGRRGEGEDRGAAFNEKEVESSAKPLGLMRCTVRRGINAGSGGRGWGGGGGGSPSRGEAPAHLGPMDFRDFRNKPKPKRARPRCADSAVTEPREPLREGGRGGMGMEGVRGAEKTEPRCPRKEKERVQGQARGREGGKKRRLGNFSRRKRSARLGLRSRAGSSRTPGTPGAPVLTPRVEARSALDTQARIPTRGSQFAGWLPMWHLALSESQAVVLPVGSRHCGDTHQSPGLLKHTEPQERKS